MNKTTIVSVTKDGNEPLLVRLWRTRGWLGRPWIAAFHSGYSSTPRFEAQDREGAGR
jgi:hypothetical protein